MELVEVTKDNIDDEHICCAISNKNDIQVSSKKSWMKQRFDDGLIFKKGNVRGKCFIEYIPAENAWEPIEAPGYIFIDCFWVSGQHKGQGWSNVLLEECIRDAKTQGKKGLVTISSTKKAGFLADPKHLKHKGFIEADSTEPYFTLLYLPFEEGATPPRFAKSVNGSPEEPGFVLYYTHQCPFNAKYVPIIEELAHKLHIPFTSVQLTTKEAAQKAFKPHTSYSVFYDGEFITQEVLSEKKFEKILVEKGLA